ncbi:hypothetical protein Poli38472_009147 [Pythium oligandrum]|uniref:EF-hand domain-containing protein n=1 Tax=Pythium oligandrum TaxID=41045 RepID=A0A8K1FIH1_PYTOL|nr:hypothetical protein Poli38472_009147 [Pythium oligandrum]|eukprot:TMW64980.1 hypothetical protein Poli38472_009147 [Pythium oligandrum]
MDLIQASFQASFNAQIERLVEQETAELRTIFRYFDSDGDGAVSADQACRIFNLLGLDVNPSQVRDLEDVYMAEFMKIVDSHIPAATNVDSDAVPTVVGEAPKQEPSHPTVNAAPPAVAQPEGTPVNPSNGPQGATENGQVPPVGEDESAVQKRNEQLWEDEWKVIDSYRRGFVTSDELRLFLKSCFSPFPIRDLPRFLELYADPSVPEDDMMLTKVSFLKFRQEYTTRDQAGSDRGLASEDEDDAENENDDLRFSVDQHTTGRSDTKSGGEGASQANTRRGGRRRRSSLGLLNADTGVDGIIVDAGVLDQSDEDYVDEDDLRDEDNAMTSRADAYTPLPHELHPDDAE